MSSQAATKPELNIGADYIFDMIKAHKDDRGDKAGHTILGNYIYELKSNADIPQLRTLYQNLENSCFKYLVKSSQLNLEFFAWFLSELPLIKDKAHFIENLSDNISLLTDDNIIPPGNKLIFLRILLDNNKELDDSHISIIQQYKSDYFWICIRLLFTDHILKVSKSKTAIDKDIYNDAKESVSEYLKTNIKNNSDTGQAEKEYNHLLSLSLFITLECEKLNSASLQIFKSNIYLIFSSWLIHCGVYKENFENWCIEHDILLQFETRNRSFLTREKFADA